MVRAVVMGLGQNVGLLWEWWVPTIEEHSGNKMAVPVATLTLMTVVIHSSHEIPRLHTRRAFEIGVTELEAISMVEFPHVWPIALLTGRGGSEAQEG